MKQPIVMSWSGGKDAARALFELRDDASYEVVRLLATASAETGRVSHHEIHSSLLRKQADSLGLPLDIIKLPVATGEACTTDSYADIMRRAMEAYVAEGIRHVGFGDIFLEDLRRWREERLAEVSMQAVFPLWRHDTRQLAESNLELGFRAYVVSAQERLGRDAIGVPYDRSFLGNLPDGTDPCGENGEFHTFVYDAPNFSAPVSVSPGAPYLAGSHLYADLHLAGQGEA